jgi:serine/threonine protein kinase
LEYEVDILSKISQYHNRHTKNIVNFLGTVEPGLLAMKLEYILGQTLHERIVNNTIRYNKLFDYSSDILDGLIEMRQAGVWHHRDIRPANIMIDEEEDKAVIIDLGIATIEREWYPHVSEDGSVSNRRFGGPNDLVSLGQLMFYMATNEYLFEDSESMTRTTLYDSMKDQRDIVYMDTTGDRLKPFLQKVDENIEDETLSYLIKECLTARNGHYRQMQRKFERVLNDS